MITVVIVAFTISLGLQMTTYLLAESPEQFNIVYLSFLLTLLRDVSANVGGDGRTPFHMSQISKSDHGETSFRSRQQNRQLSETPQISFRESEHDEQLPRFSRLRRKVSVPIGIPNMNSAEINSCAVNLIR